MLLVNHMLTMSARLRRHCLRSHHHGIRPCLGDLLADELTVGLERRLSHGLFLDWCCQALDTDSIGILQRRLPLEGGALAMALAMDLLPLELLALQLLSMHLAHVSLDVLFRQFGWHVL